MARLASLLKGGYYPLSEVNTLAARSLIRPADTESLHNNTYYTRRPYTLLDPFCGEGAALAAFAEAWNAAPYGVELHPERGETAQNRIGKDRVLIGPAEGLVSSGFDVVYANPPYDDMVEVELTLIAAGHVQPGGLLVTALPEKATLRVLEALTGADGQLFSVLFARWAPDPEWKQVVAVLKRERYDYYAQKWEPAPFEPWSPPDQPFEPETSRFHPHGEALVETFKMRRITKLLDAASEVAKTADVFGLVAEARADESSGLRPLTPLRSGHLAALLASGLLNQVEVEVDGRRLAIKGTTGYQVTKGVEVQGDATYKVERRSPQTAILFLDLDTGEIEQIRPSDEGFADVLHKALPALLERFEEDVKPVWTGLSDADRRVLAEVRSPHPKITGGLLPSQMRTASALVAGLSRGKAALLIGEMGTGKTLTSLGAWHLLRRGKPDSKLAIICPPHLAAKWKREAAKALPYARVSIVKSVSDVDSAMQSPVPAVMVMSHSASRDGSGWEPAVMRLKHLGIDRCPGCGQPVELKKTKAMKCPACKTPLWQQKRLKSGVGKYPLADYLRKRYRGQYDLTLDECHEFKAEDSQRAVAAHRAIVGARKVLSLSGTPYGGKASTVYFLYHRLIAEFREVYGFKDKWDFIGAFGSTEVRERVSDDAEYGSSWTYRKRARREPKEAPGVSPGIISWALPHAVFLSLEDVAPDLSAALPPYNEHIHLVGMDARMQGRYTLLNRMRSAGIAELTQGSASLFSTWMMAALSWPDNPTTDVVHTHPETKEETVWLNGLPVDAGEKERAIVDLAAEAVAGGRAVAIYVGQPATRNPAAFLRPLLEARGLTVDELTSSVGTADREAWLAERNCDVLIVNPKLVETGLDLLRHPIIIFDGIPSFSCYTLQQAARRSWRIGQCKPVDVHYVAYSGTLQANALQLMAQKAAAATAFNGEALEALAAFGDDSGDLLSSLRAQVLDAGGEVPEVEIEWSANGKPVSESQLGGWVEQQVVRSDSAGRSNDDAFADEVAGWLHDQGTLFERDVVVAAPNGTNGKAASGNGKVRKPVTLGENADAYDYLPPEVRAALPPLYSTDGKGVDAVAQVKYFTPDSSWTWYATELDPETEECFGLVVGQDIELGYFSLAEFAEVRGHLGLKVERDLWFKPTPVRDLVEMHRDAPGVMHCAVHVDVKAGEVETEGESEAPAESLTHEALLEGLPVGKFKGHLILELPNGDNPFSFGAAKAGVVAARLDAIREFLDKYEALKGDKFGRLREIGDCHVTMYRNAPVLNLPLGSGRFFSFGKRKAELLLKHTEWIVRFAAAEGKTPEAQLAKVGVSQVVSTFVETEADPIPTPVAESGEEPACKRLVVGSEEANRLAAQAKRRSKNKRTRSSARNGHVESVQLSLFDFGTESGEQSEQLVLFMS